jgi:hypothetical protein
VGCDDLWKVIRKAAGVDESAPQSMERTGS